MIRIIIIIIVIIIIIIMIIIIIIIFPRHYTGKFTEFNFTDSSSNF